MKKLTNKEATKYLKMIVGKNYEEKKQLEEQAVKDAENLIDFIVATKKAKAMTAKYMSDLKNEEKARLKKYLRTTTNYDIQFTINSINEARYGHKISSVSSNYVYISKNKTIIDAKKDLKEIQKLLYILSFNKHFELIKEIDTYVETVKSINNNNILFLEEYYKEVIKKADHAIQKEINAEIRAAA